MRNIIKLALAGLLSVSTFAVCLGDVTSGIQYSSY